MKLLITSMAFLVAGSALADTLSYSYSEGPSNPWKSSYTMTFPKFDPQLGTLTNVEIEAISILSCSYSGQNLANGFNQITPRLFGWADLKSPAGGNLGRRNFSLSNTTTLSKNQVILNFDLGASSQVWSKSSVSFLGLPSFTGSGNIAFKVDYVAGDELIATGGPNSMNDRFDPVDSVAATLHYTYTPVRRVSGNLNFGGLVPGGVQPANAQFEFRLAGSQTIVSTVSAPIGVDGSFNVVAPGQANYELAVKPSHWLRKRVGVNLTSSNATGVQIGLTNGDCNNDNSVDLLDYFVLSDSYNLSAGEGGFVSNADLNGDLSVDLLDYFILSDNYLAEGDAA